MQTHELIADAGSRLATVDTRKGALWGLALLGSCSPPFSMYKCLIKYAVSLNPN